ncbi:MAG: hypothetical protein C5B53_13640 [Candidatus Melainabacteria bacterium]|nr:MAG: hypothetical protein C5B53_13640 [Candidatus Melainabacteria bacterium]
MSRSKVPTEPSTERTEASAASAAVLYYLETSLENPLGFKEQSRDSAWGRIAQLESVGAGNFCSAAFPGSSLNRPLWQLSARFLIAVILFGGAFVVTTESPAQAGLLSFFHHKKKHHPEFVDETSEETSAAPASNPLSSPSRPVQPQTAPKGASPTFYQRRTTSADYYGKDRGSGESLAPPLKSVKRDWLPPQPTNCACLGNQKQIIRIGVAFNIASFELITPDGAQLIDASSGAMVARLPPQNRWSTASANQNLVFRPKQPAQLGSARWATENSGQARLKSVAYYQPAVPNFQDDSNYGDRCLALPLTGSPTGAGYFVRPFDSGNQEGVVGLNGRLFRGALLIQPANPAGTAFNAINYLSIEDYLLSVVPSEMPSAWPLEALKAQAIAARSYAYANLGKHGSEGYDLKDNTEDQAYSGIKSEYNSTNLAVASTNNLVMKYDGKPICAYFHSTSGGSTELSENVWSKPLPYLKAVADYDDLSPHFSWSRKFSIDEIEAKLASGVAPVLTLFVVSRSQSQRVSNLLVVGKNNAKIFSGESVRRQLKLPSTNFNVFSLPGCYTFCGRGYGHGLGLSQWGARALAEQGYNAAQILTYYYKDIVIEPVVDNSGS